MPLTIDDFRPFDALKYEMISWVWYYSPMKTLILETSTEKSCLCLKDGETIICTAFLNGGPELSKNIAMEVSNLLKENNVKPEQIAVGRGPGSLTGVRVGAALGKALAYAWNIPYIEFCSLSTFAPEQGPFAVLVDARLGGIYLLTHESKTELLPPEDAKRKIENIPHLFSPHPAIIEKRISRKVTEESPKLTNVLI